MGRWTEHTSGDVGGHGDPVLCWVENGSRRVYNQGRGGPVHHMMVGPRHVTHEAKLLPAQSRTRIAVVWVKTLTAAAAKITQQHKGMDSDLLHQIPSPSSHFLYRIY